MWFPRGAYLYGVGRDALYRVDRTLGEYVTLASNPGTSLYRIAVKADNSKLAYLFEYGAVNVVDMTTLTEISVPVPFTPETLLVDSSFENAILYNGSSRNGCAIARVPLREGAKADVFSRHKGHCMLVEQTRAIRTTYSERGVSVYSEIGENMEATHIEALDYASGATTLIYRYEHPSPRNLATDIFSNEERAVLYVQEAFPRARFLLDYNWKTGTTTKIPIDTTVRGSRLVPGFAFSSPAGDEVHLPSLTDDRVRLVTLTLATGQLRLRDLGNFLSPEGAPLDWDNDRLGGMGQLPDGSIWMDIDGILFFVDPHGVAFRVDLAPLVGRSERDFAGVADFFAAPDEFWIGVERGSTRDFFRFPLADIYRRSRPLANSADEQLTPGITEVYPPAFKPGEEIEIRGVGLQPVDVPTLGTLPLEDVKLRDGVLKARVPRKAQKSAELRVTRRKKVAAATTSASLLLPPLLTRVSVSVAKPGDVFTLTGKNLEHVTRVVLNDKELALEPERTSGSLKVRIPEGAKSGTIVVSGAGGEARWRRDLTIWTPPRIDRVNADAATPAGLLRIEGAHLEQRDLTVRWGTTLLRIEEQAADHVLVRLPKKPAKGALSVKLRSAQQVVLLELHFRAEISFDASVRLQ
jgi:hypothetical protein